MLAATENREDDLDRDTQSPEITSGNASDRHFSNSLTRRGIAAQSDIQDAVILVNHNKSSFTFP